MDNRILIPYSIIENMKKIGEVDLKILLYLAAYTSINSQNLDFVMKATSLTQFLVMHGLSRLTDRGLIKLLNDGYYVLVEQ